MRRRREKIHTPHAIKSLIHPIEPGEMPNVVNSMIWDGDCAEAWWVAEELMLHPRVCSHVDDWRSSSCDHWRATYAALYAVRRGKRPRHHPPGACDREEAERERRKGFAPPKLTLVSIVALALAGCVSEDVGREYACTATFVCDGSPFAITPTHGCASSDDEARELFTIALDDLTEAARCTSRSYENITCEQTKEWCTR